MEWVSVGKQRRGRPKTTWEMGIRGTISEKDLAEELWNEGHIFTKRKQVGIQLGKIYWLLGNKSQLLTC